MKQLILFLNIVFFSINISDSISAELKCNINENKCTQVNFDKNKKNIYEYIGGIKNGKAEGKGKFYLVNEPNFFSEGTYTTNKLNEITLITGVIHLPEADYFLKNKNIYKIVYKNGQILEGTFDQETRIIKEGTQSFSNTKEKFTGKFNKGTFQEGTFIFSDGTKFTGTYEGNRPKRGLMIYNNGETFTGSFINDTKLTYVLDEGILKLRDGSRYEGKFFKDRKYKSGTYYFKDGGKTVFTEGNEQYYPPISKVSSKQTSNTKDSNWDFLEILKYPLGALALFLVYYFLKDIVVAIMKTSIGGIIKFYLMMGGFIIIIMIIWFFFCTIFRFC